MKNPCLLYQELTENILGACFEVILELKAAKSIAPEHQAQIINYLKATRIEVGLLINFGPTKLVFIRKRFFSALAVSIRGLACAAYLCTPPRNPLIFLPGRKISRFRIENQQFHIRSFRMETS